jgi:hypothetical protein
MNRLDITNYLQVARKYLVGCQFDMPFHELNSLHDNEETNQICSCSCKFITSLFDISDGNNITPKH